MEWFNMGGRAWFVWGSYGVCFALLAVECVLLARRCAALKQKAADES
jgi:heme exporter protein CcmD